MILAKLVYEKNVSYLLTYAIQLHVYTYNDDLLKKINRVGNLHVRFYFKIGVVFIVFSISVSNFMENAGMEKQPKIIIRKMGILLTVIKTK